MARPTKQGIDYFPLDTLWDDKTELFLLETEDKGLGVLVTLWQLIYSNNGYYINYNDDLFLLLKKRIMTPIELSESIIRVAIKRNVFNESIFNEHKILTSKAIQKRYFDISKKKKRVDVVENYICSGVSVGKNWVNVGINATNVKVEVEVKGKEEVEGKEDKKKEEKEVADFSVFAMSNYELSEIKRIRKKNKGGVITQRVANGLAKEFAQARSLGYSTDFILTEWETRGWKSFKSDWLDNKKNAADVGRREFINKRNRELGIPELPEENKSIEGEVIERE